MRTRRRADFLIVFSLYYITTKFRFFTDGNENADGSPEESTRGKKRKHEDEDENWVFALAELSY